MRNRCMSVLLVISAMIASIGAGACGDYKGRTPIATSGTLVGRDSPFTLGVQPAQLLRRPAFGSACLSRQEFLMPFQLRFRSESSSALFLNQVRFQFIDSEGLASPRIALGQPDLLSHFGTVGIPPLGLREFPFSVPLGCGAQPVGNLSIFVETIDSTRASTGRTMTLAVR